MGRKNTGTIYVRPNGVVQGKYYYKRKRYTIYGNSKEEVQLRLNEIIVAIENGTYIQKEYITLTDWLREWLDTYAINKIRNGTRISYEGYIENHIAANAVGSIKLNDLTVEDLQEFFNKEKDTGSLKHHEGLSPKTLRNMRNMLNEALKLAVIAKKIPTNPIDGVVIPPAHQKQITVISETAQDQLITAIKKMNYPLANGVILDLYTGLRIGELMGLQWSDINLEAKTIRISRQLLRQGKPRKENADMYQIISKNVETSKTCLMFGPPKTDKGVRTIFLNKESFYALQKLHEYQEILNPQHLSSFNPYNLVLCTVDGGPVESSYYSDIFHRVLRDAGLPSTHMHVLRHTFATRALNKGADFNTVADLLGHTDASFTLRVYGHSTDETRRKVIQSLADTPKKPSFSMAWDELNKQKSDNS